MSTLYNGHFSERFLELFARRPFAVFFRVFVIVYAVEKQEFVYVVLFLLAVALWILESIALYVDPALLRGKLIGVTNALFIILAIGIAIIHVAPYIK